MFALLTMDTAYGLSKCCREHRSVEFKRFRTLIEKTIPQELQIHQVLDNCSIHKTALIHASIERRLAQITRLRIRRAKFRSTPALETPITECLAVYNRDTRSFM